MSMIISVICSGRYAQQDTIARADVSPVEKVQVRRPGLGGGGKFGTEPTLPTILHNASVQKGGMFSMTPILL